jgi:outer membrane biosynthesis protein TonB
MANDVKLELSFEIFKGEEHLRSETLSAESVTIGRGPAAMLRVEDDSLADLHAVVNISDDGAVQILDLGGASGTQLNGESVSNASIGSGDELVMGDIRVKVSFQPAASAAETPLAQKTAQSVDETPIPPAAEPEAENTDQTMPVSSPAPAPESIADAADNGEDVMAFIMRSGTAKGGAGVDANKPKVLEIAEIWGDSVMDVQHFQPGQKRISIGTSTGYRWRFVGVPLAWVPPAFAKVTWLLAPTLSEASEEWRNDFYVPPEDLPHDDFALFEWAGGGYVFNMSDKWSGFVDIGKDRHTFQSLIESGTASAVGPGQYQVPVDGETRVVADLGHVIFFGQNVAPSKKVKGAVDLDYPFLGIMAFMFFIMIMLGGFVISAGPPPESEAMEIPDRFVDLLLQQPEPEEQKEDTKPDANPDAGEGEKAKKEEGKVGKKDAKMEKAKGNKVEMEQRQADKEIAENAGVLGALRDGAELDGVFGSSNLNSDLAGGIGGLIGAKGTQIGAGGLGARGSGLGGGGSAGGLGGMGTKGRGSGASGYGSGSGNFGAKGEGGIGRIGGDPIIMGALDKSLIDRVIKRHMNQIKYCYQKQLTKNPNLGGKITVKFVIAKDGSVSKAKTKKSTMGNSSVEGCINRRFHRFKFPEPKGGGIVIVSYPFIFSPG